MGQVITGLCKEDPDIEIVAGIDVSNHIKNEYPVYQSLWAVSYTHLDVYKRQRDREGGTCLLCSDYPKGDAELFKGSVVHKVS